MDVKLINKMREVAVKVAPLIIGALKQKDENGKSALDKLYDKMKEKSKEIGKVFTEEGLREALSYAERSFDSIDFKTVVFLVKKSYKLKSGWRVCVLKTDGEITQLDILAYDDNDELVFSPECPWIHVNASELEPDIVDMFGNKSMLILQ